MHFYSRFTKYILKETWLFRKQKLKLSVVSEGLVGKHTMVARTCWHHGPILCRGAGSLVHHCLDVLSASVKAAEKAEILEQKRKQL